MAPQVNSRGGVAAVLMATMFWSFGGVLGKSTHASGVVLSFWRMWIAVAMLSVVMVVTKKWPSSSDFRRSAIAGVLFGLNICVFFIAIETVSIATALIIAALGPVIVLPVSVAFFGERATALKMVCAAVSVLGVIVAVIAAPDNVSGDRNSTVGYLWAVLSLALWLAYLLVSKGVRSEVETVRFMFVVSVIGALTVSVLVVIGSKNLGQIHGAGWAWVVLLAIGPGIAGHGLVAWAQPRVDASVTSVLIQAEPVGASAAAWIFLGQRVSLAQALAMAAVIAALCVLAYSESREGVVEIVDAVS
jgi:drug/metabolite transporter (DMT)-like permease